MSRSAILHLNTDTNNTSNKFLNKAGTSFNATLHGTPLHLNHTRNPHHLPSSQLTSSIPSSQVGTQNQINQLQNYNQSRRNSHLHLVQDLISGNSTIKIKTPQKNPLGSSSGGAPATGVVALRKNSLTGSTDFSETIIVSNGSNSSNNNNAPNKLSTLNFYSTMPLSRTRSLLANINGVAGGGVSNVSNGGGTGSGSTGSGGPGSAGSGNGSSSSSANTPNEQINGITNGFSSSYLPSITTNGTGDHILPPLKSTPLKTNNSGSVINSSSAGGILFNGVAAINSTNATISNGYSGTNTNSTTNNSSITNRDYSLTNGHNINHHSNHHHYNNHHHNHGSSHHGLTNGAMNNKDLDAISTNSVIMSSVSSNIQQPQTSLTNGISSSNSGSNSNSNGFHMNGMQTLPLVRHNSHNPSTGGGASNNDSNDRLQQNGTSGGSVAMDASPKHGIQITTVGGGSSSSTTSTNAINSNIAASVIGGSNNSNNQINGTISSGTNSANTGSLKPKTMVATPEQVMKLYMNKLTPYEHHEIFSYPQIYFIGANAKKRPGIIGGPNNCGYDDDQGSYTHIAHDHLAYRYEVLKVIGKGSFGQVVKAYDHKSHHHVALKMVRNEKRFHRQAQEEIRILEHLRKQDKDNTFNIIHMYDHFTFRSHTCITFELLSINLYELIKKNKFQGFSLQLVRKFAHSLLQCLDLLFRNKIIHCDMKPENVLLKQQGRSGIKVRKNIYFLHCVIL